MQKYVALLRGINVGGNNKVDMKKLKVVFESLGFTHVFTYINSGNIIFESDKKAQGILAKEIEAALERNFGFAIKVIVRDAQNIQLLCKKIPKEWTNNTEQKTDILFLWEEFDKESTCDAIRTNPAVDTLQYIDGAIVWNIHRNNYSQSGMHTFIGTAIYKNMTARNVNTVRKLAGLLS